MKYPEQTYKAKSHGVSRLRYHVVLVCKYRRRALEGIAREVESVLHDIEARSDFEIVKMAVEPEHVHLVISAPPSASPLSVVRRLKMMSSDMLWKSCPDHLRKFYWKRRKVLWTKGYFVATLGQVSENVVLEYVQNQGIRD